MDADTFWSRVKVGAPDECWPWARKCMPNGYGYLKAKQRMHYTHRYAYELTYGPIPSGMQICHACDNPPCCNPAHLFLGTAKDNVQDRERKGRGRKGRKFPNQSPPGLFGEHHGMSKLTAAQVREARQIYAQGNITFKELAPRYNVTKVTLRDAIRGITWKHID